MALLVEVFILLILPQINNLHHPVFTLYKELDLKKIEKIKSHVITCNNKENLFLIN
jgi:hypothetical protein